MKIGILGSAIVGQVVGRSLVQQGHDVVIGTRTPENLDARRGMGESLGQWLESVDHRGRVATMADAAVHGEIVINATAGKGSLHALELAGEEHLNGKILIDISNPLDFSKGMPPSLTVCNTDSLGEQIQRTYPDVKVVKALNTVNAYVMVNPRQLADGDHHIFICGEDIEAKKRVAGYLKEWFGWREVIDLGDISMARGAEMYLPFWIRMMQTLGTPMFNIKIVR